MSTAEVKAREFFNAHHIASMPEDVKRQLIILMLSNDTSNSEKQDTIPLYSEGELERRCMTAYQQADMGYAKPVEEFFKVAEEEHPWLSE